jgi:membrane protein DedA with SNARE-associated domain
MLTASLTGSLTSFISSHGVYAVFGLMALDAIFPAASELVMLYAGALAAGAFSHERVVFFGAHVPSGGWAFVTLALAGTVGYFLGSLVGWAIGIYGGRPLLERQGRWLHLSAANLDQAERWFARFGSWAVFLGRLTPVVRSFISIPAGVFGSPLGRYSVLTLAGSAIWCFALAGAGYGLGKSYEHVHHDFRYADYVVLAVAATIAIGIGLVVARRRRAARPTRKARS